VQSVKADTVALESSIRAEGMRHLSQGRLASNELMSGVRLDALQAVRVASEGSREILQGVKAAAIAQLADAKREVPFAWGKSHWVRAMPVQTATDFCRWVGERCCDGSSSAEAVADARAFTATAMDAVGTASRQSLRESMTRSEALMREIAGQGPDKTLKRGFAPESGQQDGKSVTRACPDISSDAALEIEFGDGKVSAVTHRPQ
jgi:exodeoxyribonuclease VII large subunit